MDGLNNNDESMRKTTSCKKTSESLSWSTSLIGHKNIFVANQEEGVQTLLELVRYKKTIPQLLIRWSVQKNYITIPKSSKQERILENADIFDFAISEEDMKSLNNMPTEQCALMRNVTDSPWIS
ncbi:hypothetical protein ACROYT_G012627 [Oculina patagonica]